MTAHTTCTVCGGLCAAESAPFARPLCTFHITMPCWACGKRYPQHLDVMDPRATPRVPCLLLKANFWPDIKHAPAPPPTEPSTQCKRCDMYRTTLRAIANAGDNGVNGGGLADLARLALLTGKAET